MCAKTSRAPGFAVVALLQRSRNSRVYATISMNVPRRLDWASTTNTRNVFGRQKLQDAAGQQQESTGTSSAIFQHIYAVGNFLTNCERFFTYAAREHLRRAKHALPFHLA